MKKLIIAISLLATFSCSKNSIINPATNNCEKVAEQYLKVVEEWSNDIGNKTKCEAVKKSLNEVLKSCNTYSAAQRKIYEDQLKDFTCD